MFGTTGIIVCFVMIAFLSIELSNGNPIIGELCNEISLERKAEKIRKEKETNGCVIIYRFSW